MKTRGKILWILCCLVSLSYAQDKETYFTLDLAYSNQVMRESNYSPTIYEVYESDLIHKYIESEEKQSAVLAKDHPVANSIVRALKSKNNKSFILGKKADLDTLSGSFNNVANYLALGDNFEEFFKNELIQESVVGGLNVTNDLIQLNKYTTVIFHVDTGRYYFVQSDFIQTFDFSNQVIPRMFAHKTIVRHDNFQPTKKVEDKIEQLIHQYEVMIAKSKEFTKELRIYDKLANTTTISETQMIAWKRKVVEAKLLNFRIIDFQSKYLSSGNSIQHYVNKDIIIYYNDFSEALKNTGKYVSF